MYLKIYFSICLIIFANFSFTANAISHAPIGVMGDHYHKAGEKMLSIRYSTMQMKGNSFNDNSISDQNIITDQANPFASIPGAPTNLSVVPKKMEMQMVMVGGMYAYSDDLTYMSMLMFMKNKMTSNTYKGAMDRAYLGSFQTSLNDLSNITFSALYRLYETNNNRWHLELGLDKSIGKNDNKAIMLTPMNAYMEMTMPYSMQMDESTRLISGLTNSRNLDELVFGSQIKKYSVIDDKDWAFGDKLEVSSWLQKSYDDSLSYSVRLLFTKEQKISGFSSEIISPVQSSNPLNYGGKSLKFFLGANKIFNLFEKNHIRLGFEYMFSLEDNKNGLQMDSDDKFIVGYQMSL